MNLKMKFLIFINIVTFVLVTFKYQHYNDEKFLFYQIILYFFGGLQKKMVKSLENGKIYEITLLRRSHRILAKYENQKELMNSRLNYETQYNGGIHKLVNKRENNNTYDKLKRAKPNNMESYLNTYKYRHSKKRGLKKLDCYFEKKLFSSLDKIEKTAKKKNNGKSRIISIICGKYGLPLLLLSLVPLFAFKIPFDVGKVHKEGKDQCEVIFFDTVKKTKVKDIKHTNCNFEKIANYNLVYLFLIISIIIILLLIIYAYIKILKYMRIKEGMTK